MSEMFDCDYIQETIEEVVRERDADILQKIDELLKKEKDCMAQDEYSEQFAEHYGAIHVLEIMRVFVSGDIK